MPTDVRQSHWAVRLHFPVNVWSIQHLSPIEEIISVLCVGKHDKLAPSLV